MIGAGLGRCVLASEWVVQMGGLACDVRMLAVVWNVGGRKKVGAGVGFAGCEGMYTDRRYGPRGLM